MRRVAEATVRGRFAVFVAAGSLALAAVTTAGVTHAAEVSRRQQDPPVVPCDMPVDTSKGVWRLVDTEEVTFCVPATWKVSKRRATYRGMTVEWRSGTPSNGTKKPFVVGQVMSGGMPVAGGGAPAFRGASERAVVAGRTVELKTEGDGSRMISRAVWTDPNFYFDGTARNEDEARGLWEIYRTARPKTSP